MGFWGYRESGGSLVFFFFLEKMEFFEKETLNLTSGLLFGEDGVFSGWFCFGGGC